VGSGIDNINPDLYYLRFRPMASGVAMPGQNFEVAFLGWLDSSLFYNFVRLLECQTGDGTYKVD